MPPVTLVRKIRRQQCQVGRTSGPPEMRVQQASPDAYIAPPRAGCQGVLHALDVVGGPRPHRPQLHRRDSLRAPGPRLRVGPRIGKPPRAAPAEMRRLTPGQATWHLWLRHNGARSVEPAWDSFGCSRRPRRIADRVRLVCACQRGRDPRILAVLAKDLRGQERQAQVVPFGWTGAPTTQRPNRPRSTATRT